ncbi:MAGE-domain-containing protein [Wolfiporia cocos MD-104 SS10]|uniref:MAGE-domain-containing protein n=1 Tax=Wolfiporia cocos (strain MD-104) TaxID=742152 RepID=A0A2H3IYN9_WOLCO|nr:MAGE-domain-containing protein [Wolfiporia cocos MD-104 SS10]
MSGGDNDEEVDGGEGQTELERKANDLVRLALFTENRRVPLRRDEISKKILGSSTRQFNAVMQRGQEILHKTFGMELVELQRAAGDNLDDQDAELLKGANGKKRAIPTGTKSYILRSILHPKIISIASTPDPEILQIEKADLVQFAETHHTSDHGEDTGPGVSGCILGWSQADEVGSVGLLYTILALILVDGRTMRDSDLRTHLKHLSVGPSSPLPLTSRTTSAQSLTLDSYLASLVRQGYLEKAHGGSSASNKRGRGRPAAHSQATGEDGANAVEWRWGLRAASEVGEQSVAQFVAEFMVNVGAGGEAGSDEEGAASARWREEGRKRQFDAVMKGIERAAAGAALQDLV